MNKISKKIWILVVAIVAVLVAVIVGVNVIGSQSDYKATLKQASKAFEENNQSKLEGMASSISEKIYGQYSSSKEQYKQLINETRENYKLEVGDINKITYKVVSETPIEDSRIEELKDNLQTEYDMDTSKIQKIVQVGITVTVEGKETTVDFAENLYFVQEAGGWKIHYGYLP